MNIYFDSNIRVRRGPAICPSIMQTSGAGMPWSSSSAGVFEIAVRHRGDAFRTIYALRLDEDVWVLHAFQKKSKTGIGTPKQETDLIRERIRRVREQLA
jgi:phage-related protein